MATVGRKIKHGYSKRNKRHNLYYVWAGMKQRCINKNHPRYKDYGGRGINICKQWNEFENFLKDMGESYKKGLTLDRINNNGDYCKSNCKWSTPLEQNNNSRKNKYFTYNGLTKTLYQWAKYLNVNRSTLAQRYYVYKWPIEKVLSYNI